VEGALPSAVEEVNTESDIGMTNKMKMNQLRLNLGCGNNTPAGWVNIDYALGARLAKIPLFRFVNSKIGFFKMEWDMNIMIHNLCKSFPLADASVDVVYTSHTLEHLSKNEGISFLMECHRVLKVGGLIRIVVPDLKAIVSN
jgi:predicted SAM-dependent methyltransferase